MLLSAHYGPALQNDNFQYKLALLELRKPEIVTIGSSRVLAFRQIFFNRTFANLGGIMNNPEEGRQFVEEMLARYKPKIAIINLDFWWFNPSYSYQRTFPTHALDGTQLRGEDYLVLEKWFLSGRFTGMEMMQTVFRPDRPIDGYPPGIGIRARFSGQGFAADGSEFDFGLVLGIRPAWDRNFSQALTRIRSGIAEYAYADGFSDHSWNEFVGVIDLLASGGVHPIVIVPPVARAVDRELAARGTKFSHMTSMVQKLRTLPVPTFDFRNLDALGGSDCEFVDAVHVGDVGGLRMARSIAVEPRSPLQGMVDVEWADGVLAAAQGRALFPEDMVGVEGRETDFLDLGCPKT